MKLDLLANLVLQAHVAKEEKLVLLDQAVLLGLLGQLDH